MRMLRDFRYTTAALRVHASHVDLILDGKSTPRLLWGGYLAGSPYCGLDRFPALIHDDLCEAAESLAAEAIAAGNEKELAQAHKLRDYADAVFYEGLRFFNSDSSKPSADLGKLGKMARRIGARVWAIKAKAMRLAVRTHARWRFHCWGRAMVKSSPASTWQ